MKEYSENMQSLGLFFAQNHSGFKLTSMKLMQIVFFFGF